MNKENCALKLVDEIILYYDARSKKHQINSLSFLRETMPCLGCQRRATQCGYSVLIRDLSMWVFLKKW